VKLIFLILLSTHVMSSIWLEQNIYSVVAKVIVSESGPKVVFNSKSRLRCMIKLTGPLSEKLHTVGIKSYYLSFKISKKVKCAGSQATLISFRALKKGEKLIGPVGNNLHEIN